MEIKKKIANKEYDWSLYIPLIFLGGLLLFVWFTPIPESAKPKVSEAYWHTWICVKVKDHCWLSSVTWTSWRACDDFIENVGEHQPHVKRICVSSKDIERTGNESGNE